MEAAVACMHGGVMLEAFHVTVCFWVAADIPAADVQLRGGRRQHVQVRCRSWFDGAPWKGLVCGSVGLLWCGSGAQVRWLAGLPEVGAAAAGHGSGRGAGRAHGMRSQASMARRFDYSQDFLKWALQPSGTRPEWVLGVHMACAHKPAWRADLTTRRTS